MTNGTEFPWKMVFFNSNPDRIATTIPRTYRETITKAAWFGKNAAVIMP